MEDLEIKVRLDQENERLRQELSWFREKLDGKIVLIDCMLSKVLQAYIENTNENERKRQDFSVNIKKENNET